MSDSRPTPVPVPRRSPGFVTRLARALTAFSLITMIQSSGCVTYTEPASQRYHAVAPAEYPPSWWPTRQTEDLDRQILDGPRVLREVDAETGLTRSVARISSSVRVAEGLVQAVRPIDEDGRLVEPGQPPLLRFLSIRAPSRGAIDSIADARVGYRFTLRAPSAASGAPGGTIRALAVHLTTEEADELDAVEEALLARDIAVARIVAPPLSSRRIHASVNEDSDLEALAQRISRHVDEALADRAYAIEGVVRYADERHPDLSPGPVLFLGAGECALALPAAAIRLQGRARGVLFVAGAANVLELALTSEDLDVGIDVDGWTDQLTDGSKRWLLDLYLATARLDPYRTAPYLVQTPAVCFIGQWDDQVPNPVSALLWDQLMRPSRFRILGDHDDVLEEAEDRAEWIAEWFAATL